jgi:hypothetical protein
MRLVERRARLLSTARSRNSGIFAISINTGMVTSPALPSRAHG